MALLGMLLWHKRAAARMLRIGVELGWLDIACEFNVIVLRAY
jgi:hypothetical protein